MLGDTSSGVGLGDVSVVFEPLRLLILIDDSRGWCARVVPSMKEMLEQRGFDVDVHRVGDGPVSVDGYRGMLLGAPTFGLGIGNVAPSETFVRYVEAIEGLDEMQIGVFTVYPVRPGDSLQRLKGLVLRVGARFVAWHGFHLLRPGRGAHVLPTECMVRIR